MKVRKKGEQLLNHLRQQRAPMIEFIKSLVDLETPSAQPAGQARARGLLQRQLRQLDYKTIAVRGDAAGGHLYARRASRSRRCGAQLIIGHYDTVWPVGTLAERPFQVEGSILRGPGVFDMKGGLAQIVFALQALAELELPTPLEPVVFINADEEIGSRTSARFVHLLARRAQRAFVLEPSMGPDGALKTARKGVGRYTITVFGKAAHAGLDPEGGSSAILELSHVIQSLFALNDPEQGISVNVGTVDGGMRPNVIAPHSQAVVDVRTPTAKSAERIDQAIRGLRPSIAGTRLRIDGGIGRPALEPTARNQQLWRRAKALGQQLGIKLEQSLAGGGSDGNTTSLYTATLDGLGPVGDGAHASHEFLDVDKTIERTALLGLLLLEPQLPAAPQ